MAAGFLLPGLLLSLAATRPALADTTVTVDTPISGGNYGITPPTLIVSHADNPLLSLTNEATTSDIEALIVGNLNGEKGQLLVSGGSQLGVSGDGTTIGTYGSHTVYRGRSYLGLNAGSTGEATVTGTGSAWTNSQPLIVGDYGTGKLTVSDGGTVSNTSWGYIGYENGSNGEATVTGTDSAWTNSQDLRVGLLGTGTLNVQDGGTVSNTYGILGYYGSTGTATVTGTGSTWTNSQELHVGHLGAGTLNVQAGGTVTNTYGVLGRVSGSTGTATVTGAGSTWANSQELHVGSEGTGTLNVQAGGTVTNTLSGYLGTFSGSTGTATVNGVGSTWANSSSLYVGDSGAGTLNVQAGGTVSNTWGYLGYDSGSTGTATVTGAGSLWSNSQSLYIGGHALGNGGVGTLSITDGGLVTVGGTTKIWNGDTLTVDGGTLDTLHFDRALGTTNHRDGTIKVNGNYTQASLVLLVNGPSASKNPLLHLSGAGTHSTIETVVIGATGTSEKGQLRIDGGRVVNTTGNGTVISTIDGTNINRGYAYLGLNAGATGTATVTGIGSEWNNSRHLRVGSAGHGTLEIENGGKVTSSSGYIGFSSTGSGQATVAGTGSQWVNDGSLFVGAAGNGTLNVEAGGKVANTWGYLGEGASATGTATITGAGSEWNHQFELYVGNSGNGTLNIENSGKVTNTDGFIGFNNGSTGQVTITGAGSEWVNTGNLVLGGLSPTTATTGSGTLEILNGGKVTVGGTTKTFGGDTITVDGGTLETVNFDRTLGTVNHHDGTIKVTGDYTQANGTLVVAGNATDKNPLLHFSGTGTTTGISTMLIGQTGDTQNGQLLIDGGRTLSNSGWAAFGFGSGSTGLATVSGANSTWTNSEYLIVGWNSQSEGELQITGGGKVSNANGTIGNSTNSSGKVTVSGTDANGVASTWTNSGQLNVGWNGQGELQISGGGKVSNNWGYIGDQNGSSGKVTVAGTDANGGASTWTNNGELYVGRYSQGELQISGGGTVTNTYGYLGTYSGSSGTATVNGAGSTWTNSLRLYVGLNGVGTLNVQDGGTVSNTWGYLGYDSGSTGTATVNGAGSTWTNSQSLYVGGSISAAGGTGILTVENGGTVEVANLLKIWSTGTLNGDGGTIQGNVENLGLISPGNSAGTLTIDGDLDTTGTLRLEIAGAGSFDQLNVSGLLSLGGTIEIDFLDGYVPSGGETFELLDFGSIVDAGYTFNFAGAPLASGLDWDTSNFLTNGSLTITAVPEPSTLVIGGLSLLGLGWLRLRRKTRCSFSKTIDSHKRIFFSEQLMNRKAALSFCSRVFSVLTFTILMNAAAKGALMDGLTASTPAYSALQIKQNSPAANNGLYWLDPNGGSNADAYQAYCDMNTSGGGWTLVLASLAGSESAGNNLTTNTGTPGLLTGHTRAYATADLLQETSAQIRHTITTSTGTKFDAFYTGRFHDSLPLFSEWTLISGSTIGAETLLANSFGQPYTTQSGNSWYFNGANYSTIPSLSSDAVNGPANSSGTSIASYQIWVRGSLTPITAVPEPNTLVLGGLVLLGLGGWLRSRRGSPA